MGGIMIRKIADNIISPLGFSSDDNFRAVMSGHTELKANRTDFDLPEPFCGSLLDREKISNMFVAETGITEGYSLFEQLCILSASKALKDSGIDTNSASVVFVFSTTKGNVDYLAEDLMDERCYIGESATRIAKYFGNNNTPIVASNACISGVCAQIAAVRSLLQGKYTDAIVIGCDVLSKFIVSGFQSFKALSPELCKPYDKERVGLNLGEAVGTMILTTRNCDTAQWRYVSSSNHNDANHISGPSRTGEGSFRVLSDILREVDADSLSCINAHGTATAYNDEMESIAIHRAGLDAIPVNGLKGYYGHTLGAAGIIETILSMKAVDNQVVLPTKGFETTGTTYSLNISNQSRRSDKTTFIKILSGFGGSNAGIAWQKGGAK
jgi:3-oxoacyl-[acyl-carrier-protein] synthase-1